MDLAPTHRRSTAPRLATVATLLVAAVTLRSVVHDGQDLSATTRSLFDMDVEVLGSVELAQDMLALPGRSLIVQGRKRF